MTFDEYWSALNTRRAIPDDGKILMTKEQFKKTAKQIWEIGYDHAKSKKSMFGEIFGGD